MTLVLLFMTAWTLVFLWTITDFTPASPVTPALGYFVLSLLLLFMLIPRLGTRITDALGLFQPQVRFLLLGLGLGLGYFACDHVLTVVVLKQNLNESITLWRQANQSFWLISVFISSVKLAPWFEELIFRGMLFRNLTHSIHPLLAAIISAALFALIHWQWPDMISLFVVGLLYAWLTLKSGSIYPAILAHMTHNGLIFSLYIGLFTV